MVSYQSLRDPMTGQVRDDMILRASDGTHIPADPLNTDWQAYQAWLAQGNTAAAAPAVAPVVPTLTFLQFMALFTPAEQAAIVASADPQVKLFTLMASGAGRLQLDDPEVITGIAYLANASTAAPPGPGILSATRQAQVLAGEPPSAPTTASA